MMAEEELDYGEEVGEEDAYGPALPPHLKDDAEDEEASGTIGPALPPGPIGPQIPSHLLQPTSAPSSSDSESEEEDLHPNQPVLGPALPPGMTIQSLKAQEPQPASSCPEKDDYGPAPPPRLGEPQEEEEEDEDDYGPSLPPPVSEDDQVPDYEDRLRLLRTREALKKHRNRREEWMTELPKGGLSQNLGLTARTFSKASGREKAEATDEWTTAPEDRLLGVKAKSATDGPSSALIARDQELAKRAEQLNAARNESLLDQHSKKRLSDKEEAEAGGKARRREFNREEDVLGGGGRGLGPGGVAKARDQATALGSRLSAFGIQEEAEAGGKARRREFNREEDVLGGGGRGLGPGGVAKARDQATALGSRLSAFGIQEEAEAGGKARRREFNREEDVLGGGGRGLGPGGVAKARDQATALGSRLSAFGIQEEAEAGGKARRREFNREEDVLGGGGRGLGPGGVAKARDQATALGSRLSAFGIQEEAEAGGKARRREFNREEDVLGGGGRGLGPGGVAKARDQATALGSRLSAFGIQEEAEAGGKARRREFNREEDVLGGGGRGLGPGGVAKARDQATALGSRLSAFGIQEEAEAGGKARRREFNREEDVLGGGGRGLGPGGVAKARDQATALGSRLSAFGIQEEAEAGGKARRREFNREEDVLGGGGRGLGPGGVAKARDQATALGSRLSAFGIQEEAETGGKARRREFNREEDVLGGGGRGLGPGGVAKARDQATALGSRLSAFGIQEEAEAGGKARRREFNREEDVLGGGGRGLGPGGVAKARDQATALGSRLSAFGIQEEAEAGGKARRREFNREEDVLGGGGRGLGPGGVAKARDQATALGSRLSAFGIQEEAEAGGKARRREFNREEDVLGGGGRGLGPGGVAKARDQATALGSRLSAFGIQEEAEAGGKARRREFNREEDVLGGGGRGLGPGGVAKARDQATALGSRLSAFGIQEEAEAGGKARRREFNREEDVLGGGGRGLGPGGVAKARDQATALGSRFGHGSEQKFL